MYRAEGLNDQSHSAQQLIQVRPARQGSWVVGLDDASRFMAAKRVTNDFVANLLLEPRIQKLHSAIRRSWVGGFSVAPTDQEIQQSKSEQ